MSVSAVSGAEYDRFLRLKVKLGDVGTLAGHQLVKVVQGGICDLLWGPRGEDGFVDRVEDSEALCILSKGCFGSLPLGQFLLRCLEQLGVFNGDSCLVGKGCQ